MWLRRTHWITCDKVALSRRDRPGPGYGHARLKRHGKWDGRWYFQSVRRSDLQRPRRFRVVRSVPLPWVIEAKDSCGATQVRTDRSPHPAPRLAESHQNLIWSRLGSACHISFISAGLIRVATHSDGHIREWTHAAGSALAMCVASAAQHVRVLESELYYCSLLDNLGCQRSKVRNAKLERVCTWTVGLQPDFWRLWTGLPRRHTYMEAHTVVLVNC